MLWPIKCKRPFRGIYVEIEKLKARISETELQKIKTRS
jgi:hypothetical protein